jgi:hypothetical protein
MGIFSLSHMNFVHASSSSDLVWLKEPVSQQKKNQKQLQQPVKKNYFYPSNTELQVVIGLKFLLGIVVLGFEFLKVNCRL